MNKFGALLFTSVFLAAGASAATLAVNCSVGSGPTELNANVSCPQFSLTGLSSVQITVSGNIQGTITLTNNAATTQIVNATVSSQFNVGPLAGFTFANPLFTASYGTGSRSLISNQTVTFAGLLGNGSGSLGTNTTVLAPYVGGSTFNINISTLSGISILGGGGQIGSNQSTLAQGTALVTYTYNESGVIPEPATMSMLGFGLLALAFASRRFKK